MMPCIIMNSISKMESMYKYKFFVSGPGGPFTVEEEFNADSSAALKSMKSRYAGYNVILASAGMGISNTKQASRPSEGSTVTYTQPQYHSSSPVVITKVIRERVNTPSRPLNEEERKAYEEMKNWPLWKSALWFAKVWGFVIGFLALAIVILFHSPALVLLQFGLLIYWLNR
jgi:hypothetical protein